MALGHGRDGRGHLRRGSQQVIHERIDRAFDLPPRALRRIELHALPRSPFLADHLSDALHLASDALIRGDDLVEGLGDLAVDPGPRDRQLNGEIASANVLQRAQQLSSIELARRNAVIDRRAGASVDSFHTVLSPSVRVTRACGRV